jgi:hypothetical protein
VGTANSFYIVSVAGTTTLDGISNWGVGDWATFNGTTWQRVEGGAAGNFTDLSVSGTSTLSGLTASTALALNASKQVVSVANTGTGDNVLATSPTLVTPNLGTPSTLVGTNITGTAAGLTAGNVTTNANLTGAITSVGNATSLGSFSSANLAAAVTDETGTGALVFANSPTLVTPALGTPASGVVTNLTGTASININGTVGATTASTGAFTTLAASGNVTLDGGTANGVAFLNASKVLTTGSALTFDGTNFAATGTSTLGNLVVGLPSANTELRVVRTLANSTFYAGIKQSGQSAFFSGYKSDVLVIEADPTNETDNSSIQLTIDGSERMRLTSTGLGIGTSSNRLSNKLDVFGNITIGNNASYFGQIGYNAGVGTLDLTSGDGGFRFIRQSGPVTSMTLDSSGNLGLGVTPSAYGSTYKAIQAGVYAAFVGDNNNGRVEILNNAYASANNVFNYSDTNSAGRYSMQLGAHAWFTAPSGTAGDAISFTQAMTLDASGNLVLGSTTATGRLSVNTGNGVICFRNFDSVIGAGTGSALDFLDEARTAVVDGGIRATNLTLAAFGATPVIFTTNNTERARITSGGDLLVGTTSSDGASLIQAGGDIGATYQPVGGQTAGFRMGPLGPATQAMIGYDGSSGNLDISPRDGFAIVFKAKEQGSERARITSGGDLLVGTTNNDQWFTSTNTGINLQGSSSFIAVARAGASFISNRLTSDGDTVEFRRGGTTVGSVSVTASATAYNTSSDYRLKNITGPITTSGAYIDSLNPVEGTWKADGSTFVGLIAHEVQEASRTNVATGVKDGEEMQGMDYSSAEIIANLIAEIQSLRARLAAANI